MFKDMFKNKDWRLKKLTTFASGQFPTISGHFLAKYINIFQKLRFWWSFWGAKHVWMFIGSKTMTQITIWFENCVFQFWKKKNWKFKFQKWPFLEHLWSFLGIYIDIFCRTEIQTVISRFLVCLNLNWINIYFDIIGQKHFFSCLKCINLGVKYRSKFLNLWRKPAVIFSIILFYQNYVVIS